MKVPPIDPWRVAAMVLAIIFIMSYWINYSHPSTPQPPAKLEKIK